MKRYRLGTDKPNKIGNPWLAVERAAMEGAKEGRPAWKSRPVKSGNVITVKGGKKKFIPEKAEVRSTFDEAGKRITYRIRKSRNHVVANWSPSQYSK